MPLPIGPTRVGSLTVGGICTPEMRDSLPSSPRPKGASRRRHCQRMAFVISASELSHSRLHTHCCGCPSAPLMAAAAAITSPICIALGCLPSPVALHYTDRHSLNDKNLARFHQQNVELIPLLIRPARTVWLPCTYTSVFFHICLPLKLHTPRASTSSADS